MWYGAVVWLRNRLFDRGILPSTSSSIPSIGVGNLSAGGTGKTPHVEFLIRGFSHLNTVVLSRGYGRKSKGFLLDNGTHSPSLLGDEPAMISRKHPSVRVAVAEKRVEGMAQIARLSPPPQLVILDDVFQHRYFTPSTYVLLTEYSALFSRDYILPWGNLREGRSGALRAEHIIVTKCPRELTTSQAESIKAQIAKGNQKVFFSTMEYGTPYSLFDSGRFPNEKKVAVLTAIAHPGPFVEQIREMGHEVIHCKFADHHNFSSREIRSLLSMLSSQGIHTLFTTEKDAERLRMWHSSLKEVNIQVLPIKVSILFHQEEALLSSLSAPLGD